MVNLDDPKTYLADSSDMIGHIRQLPEQCLSAWQQAEAFPIPAGYGSVNKVVVIGMGGSAIGGDLARGLAIENGAAVFVHRDYGLPPFVDERTLLVASSYSGMTEETLSGFAQAMKTNCKKLVVTRGGRLKSLADQAGVPVLTVDYIGAPRAALGYSFLPLCSFLSRLGFVSINTERVERMARMMESLSTRWGRDVPSASNQAKQLATRLADKLTVVYGAGFLEAVARRWKTQINENSKAEAFFEVFPELDHNAVVGFRNPVGLIKQTCFILLQSSYLPARIRLRYEITSEIMDREGAPYQVIEGDGDGTLSQMMSLVLLGDWVSYYLALLNQTDPTPVKVIDYLKDRLGPAS